MITADKVLSESQLSKLLKRLKAEKEKSILTIQNSAKCRPNDVRAIMDYFLITLLSHTGLRISECLNLRWPDIHDEFLIVRPEISKNKKKGAVYCGVHVISSAFKRRD